MGEITQEDIEGSIIDGIKATPYFVSTSGESHLLSEQQVTFLRSVFKKLQKNKRSWPFHLGLSPPAVLEDESYTKGIYPDLPCHICTTVVTLSPSGEVVPCPFFTDYVLGNLCEKDPLDTIWGNEKHRRFLKKQGNGGFAVCKKCSMRHFYPGVRETFRQIFYPYLFDPIPKKKHIPNETYQQGYRDIQ